MSDFKVGDKVVLTNTGCVYTAYSAFALEHKIQGFVSGFRNYAPLDTGKIQLIGEHHVTEDMIFVVSLDKGGTILVSKGGLAIAPVVKHKATVVIDQNLTIEQAQELMIQILFEEQQLMKRKIELLEMLQPLAEIVTKALQ